mmetsp:Transcript_49096/g.104922  ORF Transcript_49096/g.104922 Transcript_49096/m.104922 type:complete len:252 (-) Transcript_49096:757-1512(-)
MLLPRAMAATPTSLVGARCQHLADLLQHGTAMLGAVHRSHIDAGGVRSRLAVVAVQLGLHGHLKRLAEVPRPNSRLQGLSAALPGLESPCLLCCHGQHLHRSLVEGGEPRAISIVGEAAPEVEARRCLPCAVASSAEALEIETSIAREAVALFGLLASHVIQRLDLSLLPRLYQGEAADASEILGLVQDLVSGALHSAEIHGFSGRGISASATAAALRNLGEALLGTSLRPPTLHPLHVQASGLRDNGAAL